MDIVCRDCDAAMESARRGPARFWRCGSCGAHALTDSTLRKILPQEVWPAVWPSLRHASQPGRSRCPVCDRTMEQTAPLPKAAGVRLDICDACRVVWLDPKELEKIPKVAVPKAVEVPLELRQALAKAQVEVMNLEYDAKMASILGPLQDYAVGILLAFVGGMGTRG